MRINDVVPISRIWRDTEDFIEWINEREGPITVSLHGYPAFVAMSVKEYERLVEEAGKKSVEEIERRAIESYKLKRVKDR